MQIKEMLALPVIRDAGPRVVAGKNLVHRQVRWVHSGEIADIAKFLRGGEVLLTAATGIGGTDRARRRYIKDLAEVGAAALVIELGRGLKTVTPGMIEEAKAGKLVVVTLDREVPFVAVTHTVHTQLISNTHQSLVRATEIDDALNQLILEGAPLPAVLELFSERLRNPVLLEDTARRVVAMGRASGRIQPILRNWQRHSRTAHVASEGVSVFAAESEPRCAWTEISVRGQVWGRLHVLEVDTPLDDVVRLTLGRAGASIALQLMAQRDAYLSDEAEHSLIRGATSVHTVNGQDFIDRATGLGIPLDGELIAIVASPATPSTVDDGEDEDLLGRLVRGMRTAFADVGWPAVVGAVDDVAVAVTKSDVEGGYREMARKVAQRLAGEDAPPGCLGVSRGCRSASLPRAFQEARTAHRVVPVGAEATVQFYDELALHRLLAPLVSGPELATFVEGELGDVISYDESHNADLLRTLDAFLQTNGNKQSMGRLLHLRRRSVYYRLERIEKLVGDSLDTPDRRARLYLALRARELLDERSATDAPA